MAEIKRTQKEFYARIMEIVESANPTDREELIAFCESRVELISKKTASGRKANPLTERTEEFVREYMGEHPNEILTCTQLATKATKALEVDETITPQRISTIMKKLVAEGFAEKGKGSEYKKA